MTQTIWLTEDEQRAWRAYLLMQSRLTAQLNRELQAASDLSLSDFDVLVQLTDVESGRRRVFELGRMLQWEKSRLSHHLARMERRGLIAREECPEDARGAFVVVTEAGRAAIEAAAPAHVATVRRLVFDGITGDQVAALEAISRVVLERLDADGSTPS